MLREAHPTSLDCRSTQALWPREDQEEQKREVQNIYSVRHLKQHSVFNCVIFIYFVSGTVSLLKSRLCAVFFKHQHGVTDRELKCSGFPVASAFIFHFIIHSVHLNPSMNPVICIIQLVLLFQAPVDNFLAQKINSRLSDMTLFELYVISSNRTRLVNVSNEELSFMI